MRRIDLHCHPNTKAWFQSIQPYAEALRLYWHRPWESKSEDEVINELREADVQVLLVAFDSETENGLPPCSNDYVATVREEYPDTVLQAWGPVDPWKGEIAIRETLVALKVPIMVDTGTTGMGAGPAGGLGRHLKYANPYPALDDLAADFPELKIIAAHPAWPWTDQMIMIALHKGNVFWELSGWGPRYFPEALKHDISRRLQDKIMFGSDYPSLTRKRLFADWESLGYSDAILEKILYQNA